MSQFWKDCAALQKLSRADQLVKLKQWSSEMKVPNQTQTKPSPEVSVRSASLATDVCDGAVTVGRAANVVSNWVDNNVVGEGKEAVDDGTNLLENDSEMLQQIAEMEKKLLEIWEHCPAQFTESQAMRISTLEEKLVKAQGDNGYLESLLQIRDMDFARYLDLERQQRKRAGNLEEKVDSLEDLVKELKLQLIEKDKSMRLALLELDMVRKSDKVLVHAQKQLAKSSLALVSKQKRTKLVTAHSVKYVTTKPRPQVLDEMALAEKREWERKRLEQKSEIAALVAVVDRIAASFDRYTNVSTIINFCEPRSDVIHDHLFSWMDDEMVGLWMYAVEPTPEEETKYDEFLQKKSRPDPIYSPTLPTARVNWHRLNPNMKRNLPVPVQYPVHGCALDPEFYTTMGAEIYYLGQKMDPRLLFVSGHPFGELYGFWTSKGVLAPPDEPVGGYHCCPETGTWIIAAEGG
jgi:hypothetical protein